MKVLKLFGAALVFGGISLADAPAAQALVRGKPVHGLSLYGDVKYPADFKNFEYVNPDAPKGGTLRRRLIGTFDSFNPFSFKGTPPHPGLIHYAGNGSFFYFSEALMVRSADEPMAQYCLICETVTLAEDNMSIEYTLRAEARFHDGTPVTADDVVFSFDTLMSKGHPRYKLYWGDVAKAEKTGERKVKFTFKTDKNTELPMLVGEIPVMSKAFWEKRDIQAATLDIPNATGPYRIDRFEPGRYFVFKRDPNYWGKDLPVTRGAFNFDELRIDYYRDDDVAFRAFLAGELDIYGETDPTRWSTGYDQAMVDAGALVKEAFEDGQPDTVHPFVINTRREKFADPRVRQALGMAFDFEATNRTVGYGLMAPFTSFWMGSDIASSGLPSGLELEILERYRGQIPDEVFTTPYTPPKTDGSGNNRDNLLKAQELLTSAGWELRDGTLTNVKNGEQLTFEFLLHKPLHEKWVGPYLRNLERLGIKGTIRMVDPTQYLNRMNDFDFDMVVGEIPFWGGQSNSPGNEQREMWGSAAAGHTGSENWPGIKNPAVDAIIEDMIKAPTRETLLAHAHALDRVLLWSHLVVPAYAETKIWWAYWNILDRPAVTPMHGPNPALWWYSPEKATKTAAARASRTVSGDGGNQNLLIALAGAAVLVVLLFIVRRRRAAS
jgi:microcin C transport system substrate-binding protein